MKISVFSFNEKWILKAEAGLCEQTFKFPQADWAIEDVEKICKDESFLNAAANRFDEMHGPLREGPR
ncbi:MAG: hypothetical protein RBT63_00760 [Bdellovibrionales bacterium]|nr:hypothetical protein [Bdellovibrionales bacterium]